METVRLLKTFIQHFRARRVRRDGPDFICVGLPKAGTAWLYGQVRRHPDFWMPPVKELHAFDAGSPPARLLAAAESFKSDTRKTKHRERDAAFFSELGRPGRTWGDLDDYAALFAGRGKYLTGDITPAYAALPRSTIVRLGRRFDRTRAVLLLRDPVERAWSHWRMEIAKGTVPGALLQDGRAFAGWLDDDAIAGRSFPSAIAAKWASVFGARFRVFLLDDIAERPETLRAEIIAFLGGDPTQRPNIAPDFNIKASVPVPRSPAIQAVLEDRFRDERRRYADAFGGSASLWKDAAY